MNYRILVLVVFVLSFLISCGDDNPANSSKSKNSPQINSISPINGKAGDIITIKGINFDSIQGSNYIVFNKVKTTIVTNWNNQEISLRIPVGVSSGKVSVTVNSNKSNEVEFTVLDSNSFESVTIGSPVWMAKNLNIFHFRNGDTIPQAPVFWPWHATTTAAWSFYSNDFEYYYLHSKIYGVYYNWYAVNDLRGLAPEGWHIPSDEEWTILSEYLGGNEVAGGKMKESGLVHWYYPNQGATNESGFTALPGGFIGSYGAASNITFAGYWASSTELNTKEIWCRTIDANSPVFHKNTSTKVLSQSIRCIKD